MLETSIGLGARVNHAGTAIVGLDGRGSSGPGTHSAGCAPAIGRRSCRNVTTSDGRRSPTSSTTSYRTRAIPFCFGTSSQIGNHFVSRVTRGSRALGSEWKGEQMEKLRPEYYAAGVDADSVSIHEISSMTETGSRQCAMRPDVLVKFLAMIKKKPVEVFASRGYPFGFTWSSKWETVEPPIPPTAPPQVAQVIPFVTQREIPRRRGIWPGSYREYTATPEFRRIAAKAKKDWGYQCLMSVHHHGPVEMHHRSYRFVPFGEDWRDLIPLCEECHARFHNRLLKPPMGLFDEPEEIKRAA